jgi:hypothetical protein
MRFPTARKVACAAALLAAAVGAGTAALAQQGPPRPDFFWSYGRIQVGAANVTPPDQTIVAIVNGKVCGLARTQVANADPGNPPDDVGKTVYVIDVLADGPSSGQRPGCGRAGDPISIYLPEGHRVAAERPEFRPGLGVRTNLDMSVHLQFGMPAPIVANDGTY